MQLSNFFYLKVFKNLLAEELVIFSKNFFDQFINLIIWIVCTLFVMGYLLTSEFKVGSLFPAFMLAGNLSSAGLFDAYPAIFKFVSDLEGEKSIYYYLTLPVPAWLVLMKNAIYIAIRAFIFSLLVLPLGKLVLWNDFNLALISWPKFILILSISSFFYGIFTLWLSTNVKSLDKLELVWIRFIFPLWFLGGFQFSWKTLNNLNSYISYVALLNPITYIMEGIRASLLGQPGYLNFWLCCLAIIIFTVLCSWQALVRLKKRLDFI